jgi:hypothetical protein
MNNEHGECEYAQLGVYYLDCHCPKQCTWQRQGAYWPSCSKANGEKPEIYEVIPAIAPDEAEVDECPIA